MKYSLRQSFAWQVILLLGVILALSLTGKIAVWLNLPNSCSGWPLCISPIKWGWIQFVHRLLAGVSTVLILFIFQKAWREQRTNLVILPLTTVLTILFFGQILTGSWEILFPSTQIRLLHDLTSISLWISLVGLAIAAGFPSARSQVWGTSLPARRWKDFLVLTKPVIVALLLATTIGGLVAGYKAWPPVSLVLWTVLGGALAAGGSSALNQYIDRDLDRHMQRTSHRPLAAERLAPAEGLAFGLALCIASYFILACMVNLLAAVLSLAGIFYYVLVYSIWLKKATVQNIVIGGGAGAIPPMVGWAAATGHLPLAAWILFGIIFMWTPPHFWALAIVRKKDYERAGVPMLPVVQGEEKTRRQILLYTVLLVGVSLLLPVLHLAGSIYLVSALILGAGLLYAAWRVWRVPGNKVAYLMYRWSSLYLLLIFIALMLDAVKG